MKRADELLCKFEDRFMTLPKGWTRKSLIKFAHTLTGKTQKDSHGFFTKCVEKMKDTEIGDPNRFCAALKDRFLKTTFWRGKGKKDLKPVSKSESILTLCGECDK